MMLRIIIVLLIIYGAAFGQHEAGTIAAGSLFNFSSVGEKDDDDRVNTSSVGSTSFGFYAFSLSPGVSYFIRNDLSLDAIYSRTMVKEGEWDIAWSYYGPGASFYIGNLYVGGAYMFFKEASGDNFLKGKFLEGHGGILLPLSQNVYLDIRGSYLQGTGDIAEGDNNEDYKHPNDVNIFNLSVGVKGFFKY